MSKPSEHAGLPWARARVIFSGLICAATVGTVFVAGCSDAGGRDSSSGAAPAGEIEPIEAISGSSAVKPEPVPHEDPAKPTISVTPEHDPNVNVASRSEIADQLRKLDKSLTALTGDPLAAADPTSAAVAQWRGAVVGGSYFDNDVRTSIVTDGRDNRLAYRPGDGNTSFSHTLLEIISGSNDQVEFTYCGYAPGIGYHLDTGEILDDDRAVFHGTGVVQRQSDGSLLIAEFGHTKLRLLSSQENNPCPAEASHHGEAL